MKVWTLMIQRNSMIPNYSMISAIWWSPAIHDPQLFDDQLEVWTLIIRKSTMIPPSLMVLFSQLQMDCAKFDISLEEESWIGKKSPPSFAFITTKKLMLYHLNHFISSETCLLYCNDIATLSTLSHDSCLSEHRQCCNAYCRSSLWVSATQDGTKGAIN